MMRSNFFRIRFVFYIFLLMLHSEIVICANNKPSNSDDIEILMKEQLKSGIVGMIVIDSNTQEVLFERHSQQSFLPASTLKLVTAATALKALGPEHRFATSIFRDQSQAQDNLYIQFTGDPSLTLERFKDLVKKSIPDLHQSNFKGNLYLDISHFQGPDYPPGWSWNSLPWYYAAPISAIILNENQIPISITSNPKLGRPASIVLSDKAIPIEIKSNIETVTEIAAERECSIKVEMNEHNQATLTGCWPQHETPDQLKLAIRHPAEIVKSAIKEVFLESKLPLVGTILFGTIPNSAKLIAKSESASLEELVKPLLSDSNNLYAESIFKTLGKIKLNRGSFQAGTLAVGHILKSDFNIDPDDLNIEDGSGSSRYNLISPKQLSRILFLMNRDPKLKRIFRDALPISGMSGTLKNRMSAEDIKGKISAKTGSFYGASALAGYITRPQQSDLIFVVITNNTLHEHAQLRQFEDSLVGLFSRMSKSN